VSRDGDLPKCHGKMQDKGSKMSIVMKQETAEAEPDPRWSSVNRDAAADGSFVYAVNQADVCSYVRCRGGLKRTPHLQITRVESSLGLQPW
jgi:phage-related tail fiber protein